MKASRLLVVAPLLALGGCAEMPIDTSPLESKIAEAKAGAFGTCYTQIHHAAWKLSEAEKALAFIKNVDPVHTEATWPAAMATVDEALAARAAADEACHVRVKALEDQMPGIYAKLDDHEARLKSIEMMHELMHGVTFKYNSSALTPPAQTALDVIANMLLRHPMDVAIEGHASAPGSDGYNKALSTKRANAVKRYLASRGVPAGSMSVAGFGESDPVADNNTAAGRRANQRVIVLKAGS